MKNLNNKRKYQIGLTLPLMATVASIILAFNACFSSCTTTKENNSNSIVIKQQGSFMVGGTKITQLGTFDLKDALKPDGQTFHGDHAYAFYQIPEDANKFPLVFLHGAGQSKKTWETTPDGREGFQNIFLRRKFPVYLLDQPRRGEAGKSALQATIEPIADEQFWFTQFRLGNYPTFFRMSSFHRIQLHSSSFTGR